jgi:hypothetical protein
MKSPSFSVPMPSKPSKLIINQQRCTTVDIDGSLVCDLKSGVLKEDVTKALDYMSTYTGVDIFLLGPKLTPMVDGMTGDSEMRMDQRWRVAIYGDILSSEHAKTRVLVHIDSLVCPPTYVLQYPYLRDLTNS